MTDYINDSNFTNRNILITGGLGFIGSNLALRLVDLGAKVTLVDSLIPEYGGNLFNVENFKNKVTINISDVRDKHSMKYLVQRHHILFNLAGQTSHIDSMETPLDDLEINTKAQLFILEACRHHNPDIKIIFASTRQIYGIPQYLPVDEKHPLNPVDVNGINKLAGEGYHLIYNKVYGLHTTILRLTNTIGPRMRVKDARQTFLGIWIRLLLEGQPFEVWGGEQARDFTYVDDAIDAFLAAASQDRSNSQIFNIGGQNNIRLKELADLLIEINGGGRYLLRDFPEQRKPIDIGDYYADYQKITNSLGWTPKTTIKESLYQTLDFYKKHLKHYI